MNNPVDIYLPCQVFPVLARYGQVDDLSTLEFLILRAVKAGENKIDGLRYLFGINQRMMVDALHGLWTLQHLIVDFHEKKVYLSKTTKEMLKDPERKKLAIATAEFERCDLMVDLVCGNVMPVDGETSPPNSAATVPYVHGAITLERLTSDAIFAALNAGDRGKTFRERNMKLWEASISFQQDHDLPQIRFKKIKIASRQTETGLEVVVLDANGLNFSFRRNLSRYLTRIVNQGDDPAFVQRIRHSVGVDQMPFQELGDLLKSFMDEARKARTCAPEEVKQRHAEMKRMASMIQDAVKEEVIGQAQIDPVVGREAHEKIITEMMVKAKDQVVIACPSLSKEGLYRLRIPIRQALGNGKPVVILWGETRRGSRGTQALDSETTPYDSLDQEVKNLIVEFSSHRGFFFSQKATGTRANFVVADNNKVLMSSLNIFGPDKDTGTDIGVFVRLPNADSARKREDSVGSLPLAIDILTWAREVLPDQKADEKIKVWPKDFTARTLELPHFPESSPEINEGDEPEIVKAKINVWGKSWLQYAEESERLARSVPSAALIRDGEHRELFEKALKTARQRLVITSDGLGEKVINASSRDLLKDRIARQVPIRLVYRYPSDRRNGGSAAERALGGLAVEAGKIGADMQSIQARNNAKVLIYDDLAVVSCYSFLSNPGSYARDRGNRSTDLGLVVTGPGIADAFARAVVKAFPQLKEIAFTQAPESITAPRESQLADVVERLERHGDKSLVEIFAAASDPWRLFDEVQELQLSPAKMRKVVAACLAVTGREPDAQRYVDLIRGLARDALRRSDLIEASLLLGVADGDPDLPDSELVEIAAMAGSAEISGRITAFSLDSIQNQYYPVVVFLAISETLRTGSREMADIALLVLAETSLSPVWREALDAVFKYLDDSHDQPFPHSLLSASKRQPEREKFQDSFKKLEKLLRDLSLKQFHPADDNEAWRALFHPSGRLGSLLQLSQNRNASKLDGWLSDLGDRDAQNILLEATTRAGLSSIVSRAFIKKRASVEPMISRSLQLARKLDRELRQVKDWDTEKMIAAGKALSNTLANLWPKLSADADAALNETSRPLVAGALKYIEKVADYSRI